MKRRARMFALGAVGALCLALAAAEGTHFYRFGHLVGYGIHTDIERVTDFGGIASPFTHYRVTVLNATLFSTTLEALWSDPASYLGFGLLYRTGIEKWDQPSQTWVLVSDPDRQPCANCDIRRIRILPGRSIETNYEKLHAGAFAHGDRFRIVTIPEYERRIADQQVYRSMAITLDEGDKLIPKASSVRVH